MSDVFISYSRQDTAFVRKLHASLTAQGRDIWVDWEDIPPTAEWLAEIQAAIEAAHTLVFVLSPDSVQSQVCAAEIEHAAQHNKRLVPVVCRDVVPASVPAALARLNWLFFRPTDDFDAAFKTLITALDTDLAWVQTHTRLTVRAVEWSNKQRNTSYLLRGADLQEAEQWLTQGAGKAPLPSALHIEYVTLSRAAETRRQRQTLAAVTVGLVIAIGLAVIALYQSQVAEQRRQIAQSRQLAAQSLNLPDSRYDLALLLGLEAKRIANTGEARDSLLSGLQRLPQLTTYLYHHSQPVRAVAFSPDGQTLALGADDGLVVMIDVSTTQIIHPPLNGYTATVRSVAFSPDGQLLAASGDDGTIVVWDTRTGQPIGQLPGDKQTPVQSLAFSPDGKILAAGQANHRIGLWNVASRQWVTELKGHSGSISGLAFSPDGKWLASGSADQTIILWDAATYQASGQPFGSYWKDPRSGTGHTGPILSVAFSPDGQTLASSGETLKPGGGETYEADYSVLLWDVATRTQKERLTQHTAQVVSVAFDASGAQLASASLDHTIVVWNLARRPAVANVREAHAAAVRSVAFSQVGAHLASAGDDGRVILWNAVEQVQTESDPHSLFAALPGTDQLLMSDYSVAFSTDDKTLAVGAVDGYILVWDLSALRPDSRPEYLLGHSDNVLAVVFSPDGKLLISGGEDGAIVVWDAVRREKLDTLSGHPAEVRTVAISPDGKTVASGDSEGNIIVWDLPARREIARIASEQTFVNSLAFSPDGTMIAAGGADGTIRLWNTATRARIDQPFTGHTQDVWSVTFGPDGHTLASGSSDNTVILWNVATGQPLKRPLTGHTAWVRAVLFSPDGSLLASGDDNGQIILWNGASGEMIGQPFNIGNVGVSSLAFGHTTPVLALGTWYTAPVLMDIDLKSWQQHACRIANRNLSALEWQQYLGDEPYQRTCPDLP